MNGNGRIRVGEVFIEGEPAPIGQDTCFFFLFHVHNFGSRGYVVGDIMKMMGSTAAYEKIRLSGRMMFYEARTRDVDVMLSLINAETLAVQQKQLRIFRETQMSQTYLTRKQLMSCLVREMLFTNSSNTVGSWNHLR